MKRLIAICSLLALMLAACDAPVSDLTRQSKQSQPDIAAPSIPYSIESINPDTARKAVWEQFKMNNAPGWRVRWNKHTGLPASVFSGLSEKAYPGSAEQAARSFLADHAGLFGFTNLNNLKHLKTRTHRGIRHVTFQQTVDDVPVYEAEYKVHLQPDGRVDMANGNYYPNIEVSTHPSISKSGAINAARSDMDTAQETTLQTTSELIIYRQKEQFLLAWKLALFSHQPIVDWFYMVDAHSGEILYKLNQLTGVTGNGSVYPTHPGLSSLSNRTLYRLNGNGRLEGKYVKIINDASSEAYSGSHSFIYNSGNTHFDEANLYYHIDDFRHDFIENVDDGSLNFTRITAHAHAPFQDINNDGIADPNAWFSPSTQKLYFNDAYTPLGTNDFAKEDKIVYHEYSHAVIYDIENGIRSEHSEEGAISEGTSDYFAGSHTSRPVILDYVLANHPQRQRDMSSPDITSYSQYESEEPVEAHDGGEFFSAILWDLRNIMGGGDLDFLVYDALYRVTSDPSFLEFRDAMMAADDAAYSGANNNEIQDTFFLRGIGTYSLAASVSGPGLVRSGNNYTWSASISGGQTPYSNYTWYKRAGPSGSWQGTGMGTDYTQTISSTGDFELRVCVTDNRSISRCSNAFGVYVR